MWNSLTLGKKIWLGLSLLVLGYFGTMIFGFIDDKASEKQLNIISEYIFPSSKLSQEALAAFNEQVKLYKDAVMIGDDSIIGDAREKSLKVQKAINTIISLDGGSNEQKEELMAYVEKLKKFTQLADTVYTAMSLSSETTDEMENDIAYLAELTDILRKDLSSVMNSFSEDIKKALTLIKHSAKKQQKRNSVIFICVLFSSVILVYLIISRSISRPLRNTIAMLKDLAEGEGNLTTRLENNSRDEVGELAKWFNSFMEKLQGIINNVASNAQSLDSSSSELSELASRMVDSAKQTASQAETVSAGAIELSTNSDSVADSMDRAAANVGMVTSATDQMAATINEIAQNTEKASTITAGAVSRAEEASEQVAELGNSANAISKVVETVTDISEQVNLLALNATIEAARAGEAGKGFAVVANEIKELAKQTADATCEIESRIEGIQTNTKYTITGINGISKVVTDINEIVTGIATAVEEQSLTTSEIAENVTQVSRGIGTVNDNVSQSSLAAKEIAREISKVNQAAGDMNSSSRQVSDRAIQLSGLAEELNALVGRFKFRSVT
ncbi:hypothetical protein DSCA_36250 [Desulfosarcina alkanivorans]|uniref:Methyl-accepting chemotaxis protein n=1 Tax=Desulfosarcina alkanivorans TaxID=571177 RepID=A0A5K7YMU0_9BACT|nr:HAMP domain-containing methyl-accepting chemotaxis protein [Desulfosarcina alkanivorans]BBO69695.1 hypothetical protein DSCA_36250 [Desulfosarcina alkanivorans]